MFRPLFRMPAAAAILFAVGASASAGEHGYVRPYATYGHPSAHGGIAAPRGGPMLHMPPVPGVIRVAPGYRPQGRFAGYDARPYGQAHRFGRPYGWARPAGAPAVSYGQRSWGPRVVRVGFATGGDGYGYATSGYGYGSTGYGYGGDFSTAYTSGYDGSQSIGYATGTGVYGGQPYGTGAYAGRGYPRGHYEQPGYGYAGYGYGGGGGWSPAIAPAGGLAVYSPGAYGPGPRIVTIPTHYPPGSSPFGCTCRSDD